ncbi:OmpA family protein [Hymenobacter sp. UV11]|uniref:OmpA family protein n=1 Tax=Hymenobacter sp. UV11 TaxID=1849735 RepID=UPI00105CD2E2|nr:OmpA family protein [Hymenobacter sp. UV11]TDN38331.1 hypothetical protein A8B98_23500 [Hymenobacter sp. UV11]TFZ68072.1 OmpA family protein [Hymenobacter sp. UV11]
MITLKDMPHEIQNFVRDHNLLQANGLTGEDPAAVHTALARLSEVVLSAFAETAGQHGSREVVWNLASEAGTAPDAGQQGADLVRNVLDDRYHGTVHGVVKETQVQTATVGRLLEVAAAAALAIMGRLVATHNWSAQELNQWLRPYQVAGVVPPVAVAAAPVLAATGASGSASWLSAPSNILLLAVSLLALGEFGYIVGTRTSSAEVASVDTAAAPTPTDGLASTPPTGGQYTALPVVSRTGTGADAARSAAAVPVVLKLKNGLRQVIGAASTESKLYQFLIDPTKEVDLVDPTKDWIGFDRIYFESSKATLTNESLWQLSNVASILKRFPEAKIKIGGYTDSSGNPLSNLRLSRERAAATKDALVGMGVPTERLTAVGFGSLDNITTNDTEEGRSINRRVSMQVTDK